jgi:uncharacterized membrane protein YgcG
MGIALATFSCDAGKIPPFPTFLVTDDVGFFKDVSEVSHGGEVHVGTKLRLIAGLWAYRDVTKREVVVWVADREVEGPIPQFCRQTFNAWGIGRKGHSDGVVVFIFPSPPQDRFRIRVEVGQGLIHKNLTEQEAARLCYKYGPIIESGRHDEGVEGLVTEILTTLGR